MPKKEPLHQEEIKIPSPPVQPAGPEANVDAAEHASVHKAETKKKPADWTAQLAAAEEKAKAAQEKEAAQKELMLRTLAEYDNYRKRTKKEQESTFQNGVCFAAESLLPIIDTLYAAAEMGTADENYKKGVLLTLQECQKVFSQLGIEEIPAKGEPFDPNLHDAVLQQEQEGVESGIITLVIKKGYTLNGRVIRHSVVAVSP